LEPLPLKHPKQVPFGLIGKLLSAKPPNPQWVCDTLIAAWKFAGPLEIGPIDLPILIALVTVMFCKGKL
jgi:hypothetical protein